MMASKHLWHTKASVPFARTRARTHHTHTRCVCMMAAAAAAAGGDVIVGPFKLDGVCARLGAAPPVEGGAQRGTTPVTKQRQLLAAQTSCNACE